MKKTFYLTTAIHYANAAPHIGHAYEEVLADVIARYKRNSGLDVWFLTGMDEHGSKNLRTAKENNMDPQAFVDQNAKIFRDLFNELQISYDDFIRTSDKEKHWPGAISLWKALDDKGDIYKKKYRGLYCVGCEEFKTEKDLVGGKCPEHDKAPETTEEENYFFRASKYGGEVLNKIESGELKITPSARKNEIVSFLKEGLEDVSFSRSGKDIPWGIPVPKDATHTMYVWCDALTNYISALGYGREDELFKKYWPADMHIVGKGIFRFHAALWPAMLISAGLPLPKEIFVHGYITSEGKKMSKSIGNVVDPKKIVEKYGVEAFRYFMAREISPFEDGDFTEKKFIETYNANLANGLGNLVSRIMKMAETYLGSPVEVSQDGRLPLKFPEFQAAMENFNIQLAADVIWENISNLDEIIQKEEPFKIVKEDKEKGIKIIKELVDDLFIIAKYLEPFLPDTAKTIQHLIQKNKMPEKPLFLRIT
ncbi:MAG: methionine--tRNA ligase [Patescibacteria group bacterium]